MYMQKLNESSIVSDSDTLIPTVLYQRSEESTNSELKTIQHFQKRQLELFKLLSTSIETLQSMQIDTRESLKQILTILNSPVIDNRADETSNDNGVIQSILEDVDSKVFSGRPTIKKTKK